LDLVETVAKAIEHKNWVRKYLASLIDPELRPRKLEEVNKLVGLAKT
jgi:hypothetical protein